MLNKWTSRTIIGESEKVAKNAVDEQSSSGSLRFNTPKARLKECPIQATVSITFTFPTRQSLCPTDSLTTISPTRLGYRIFSACEVVKKGMKEVYRNAFTKARRWWNERTPRWEKTLIESRKTRLATVALGVFVLTLTTFVLFIFSQVPPRSELASIRNAVASEVYSADSVLLGRYFIQDRTEVTYEQIAPHLIDALIATEDVRFYAHSGIDIRSLGRVLIKTILMGNESAGGGSTITQQLAKNLYPRNTYPIMSLPLNKFREAIIAVRLESLYPKDEILALYLNTIPFADNTYGIQSAARRFFNTTSDALTLEQAATLVGMLKATHYYNPRLFPERARERRNVVLSQMVRYGFLSRDESDRLAALPMELDYRRPTFHDGLAPYFREHVKAEMLRWCENNRKPDGTPYNLYTDGLKIYTTLDSRLQRYAEAAVARQMKDVQRQFLQHWGKTKPWEHDERILEDAIKRSQRYQLLKEQGLSEEEIRVALETPIPMRMFSWEGSEEVVASPLDSILHHLQFLNTGFLVTDTRTGAVNAWVGGIDHDFFQYDHVRESTKRQVGSIFKPLVYAAAIDRGVAPCELISAGRETYFNEKGEPWTPRNAQYDYDVDYTMRGALAYSVNTVSVKLLHRVGIDETIQLARKLGIKSEMEHDPSISLGSSAISMMEMAGAYAAIANGGVTAYPYFIHAVRDRNGHVYQDFRPDHSGERALSEETASLVRHMLQSVVREGTASRLRWRYHIYNDIGGKTGTTQDNADGWFMAITPGLVIGSWVGADDPRIRFRSTWLGQGANTALPMVAYFLEQLNHDTLYQHIAKARFPELSWRLRSKLGCDLYELDDELMRNIEHTVWQRDSIMRADTLSAPPPETFLQMLYRRKMRMILAREENENRSNTMEATTTSARQ